MRIFICILSRLRFVSVGKLFKIEKIRIAKIMHAHEVHKKDVLISSKRQLSGHVLGKLYVFDLVNIRSALLFTINKRHAIYNRFSLTTTLLYFPPIFLSVGTFLEYALNSNGGCVTALVSEHGGM